MKKIMVVLAVFALAVATQAASFSWKVSTGSTYANMNVYCIQGTTAEAVIAAFSATDDAQKWSDAVKGLTPATATTGARGFAAANINNVTEGDNLVFAIIDGAIAEDSKWYVLSDYKVAAGTTYEPPLSGTPQAIAVGTPTFGSFTLKSGPVDPSGVPEPTSGLLLVLGGAALALRRKQK